MSLCEETKGKKTYTVVAMLFATIAAYQNGYIDQEIYQTLLAVFGATGLATLRDGINNSNKEEIKDVKTN